jgi:hypothetical protein
VGDLDGQNCPKCGADQVMNDQCLKCGIIVSKFLLVTQTSAVSFVASPTSHKEYSYTISKDHINYEERRSKDKQQRILVGLGILAVLALTVFFIWQLISHRASEFSGSYKNGELIYGMHFPTVGQKWYHGKANNLESLGIKDPHDAFYLGEDRDEPEISMAVYVEGHEFVPEKISTDRKEKLLAEAEDSLLARMRAQGVRCEIVDSYSQSIGGRDGIMIEAEIDRDGKLYRAFVLNGYYYSRAYTVFFIGKDEVMTDNEELKKLMETFSFKTSVI